MSQRTKRDEATYVQRDDVKSYIPHGRTSAKWIWHLVTEHLPDAIQIVDRFHAKQHVSDVAKALYGAKSDLAVA